jgi:hypothetical protein
MVDGAERFQAAGGPNGHQRIAVTGLGGIHQLAEKLARELRHIAGDDQIPVRRGVPERSENSTQRTFAGIEVGYRARANIGVSHQEDGPSGGADTLCHGLRQRATVERQQGFVPAHTRALSSHQHVPRPAAHTKMIPSDVQGRVLSLGFVKGMSYTEVPNILRRFCSRLGLGLGIVAGLYAADQPDRPPQQVKVVRADPRTGKLVRSVIVTAKAVAAPNAAEDAVFPRGINEAVEAIAATQSLPPGLVHSVIKVESNYNPLAVSSKGAQGLMQLMPATARRFGVANAFDPIDNIQGGTKYLKYLLDLYKGDYNLALAAYNAGEAAVDKYRAVPPYPETISYVAQVGRQLQKRSVATAPVSQPAAPQVADAQPTGPARIQEVVSADGSVRYVSR